MSQTTTTATSAEASADPFADLRHVDAGELNVAYVDAGPEDGTVVLLLHGWPYDIRSYAEVVPTLADAGYRVLIPYLRGHGQTTFRNPDAMRNAQQSALAADAVAFLDALTADRASSRASTGARERLILSPRCTQNARWGSWR